MKRWLLLSMSIGALTLLFLSNVHAAPQTHDGFYLRLATGLSVASAKANNQTSGDKGELRGNGGGANLAVGYMVIENTALFVESSNALMIGPTFEMNGMSTQTSDDVEASIAGVGLGVVHYFMPINLYVSGALVFDRIFVKVPTSPTITQEFETDSGMGLSVMIGKEWWVSDNWGLGVAAAYRQSNMTSKDGDTDWTTNAFNILFSASYN